MVEEAEQENNLPVEIDLWFQNLGLFSNHFIEVRLPQINEWQVVPELDDFRQNIIERYNSKKMQLSKMNEAQTEKEFIQPILDLLGYADSYIVQTAANGGVPDYALFPDEKTKNSAYKKMGEIDYSHCISVGDAKYWERELDISKFSKKDTFTNKNPSSQIIQYLNGTGLRWGILTNGRFWRLYNRDARVPIGNYYQVDIVKLLEAPKEKLKYFYLFFRKDALLPTPTGSGKNFLDLVLEGSNDYAIELENNIKERAYEVVQLICRGFAANSSSQQFNGTTLKEIYDNSLTFLYRLLFVFYAEARELLPLTASQSYRDNYSMRNITHKINEAVQKNYNFSTKSSLYYQNLSNLFNLIDSGDDSLDIPEYNGGLFDSSEHPFLIKNSIADSYLAPALRHLAYIKDSKLGYEIAVDYNTMSERHLGNIYEGLLEFRPTIADKNLVVHKDKNSLKYAPASEYPNKEVICKKGDLYLVNDKGERKATGSYYTPEYIVNFIVENTLDPLVKDAQTKAKTLRLAVEANIKELEHQKEKQKGSIEAIEKLDKAIAEERECLLAPYLNLKILDPAMGSGHFLTRATDFLAEAIATDPSIESFPDLDEESEIIYYRRRVVESCIYGVDLNPLSVELAKLTLWLTTMAKSKPLSFLNHHLRTGNSLIGAKIVDLDEILGVNTKKKRKKIGPTKAPVQMGQFEWAFKEKLILLLQKRAMIARNPTENLNDIDEKKDWEKDFQEIVERFRLLADLWASKYLGNKVDWEEYNTLAMNLHTAKPDWEKLIQKKSIKKALEFRREKHFFHWELEFPEVFFNEDGSRKQNIGFNAILGNPPYVLEARENAELFRELRLFPNIVKYYQKNIDLFCFFTCISIDLLARNGNHSYIVPIYWKDRTGAGKMRDKIFSECTLELLVDFDSFPVFEDAPGHHSSIYKITKGLDKTLAQRYLEIMIDAALKRQPQEKSVIKQLNTENAVPVSYRLSTGKLIANRLGQKDIIEILEKLPHFHLEEDFIVRGVDTGPSDHEGRGVFVLSQSEYDKLLPLLNVKEKELFKPFYSAFQVDAYTYDTKNYQWLIYTDRNRRLKIENSPVDYPHIIDHLDKYSKFITSDNKPYGLHRAKEEHNFLNQDKLIFVRKTPYPKFAHCEIPFFCDESMYIILPRGNAYSQFYLLSVLNSSIFNYWCSHHKTQGSQLQIDKEIILGMPIRNINFSTSENNRTESLERSKRLYHEFIHDRDMAKLLNFVSECLPINIDGTPDIEREQSDVIHDLLAFLGQEMKRLNKEKQTTIHSFHKWLEEEILKSTLEDQKGKTKIRDFYEFSFSEFLEILKHSDIVTDPCPSQIRNIIEQEFNNNISILTPIKSQTGLVNDLITQIVYKIYGLKDDEIRAMIESC